MYRKLFEPTYGKPAPEAIIESPQILDLENIARERHRTNLETVQELVGLHRKCSYYDGIMSIEIENISFFQNARSVNARIYFPKKQENASVMLFFHGGGFIMNNLDVYDHLPRYFAKYGNIVVVAVDYRLAPEHKFPAAVDDAYASLEWVTSLSKERNWDFENISVCGDSAGGNLAAVVALKARNQKGPNIRKQILMYPLVLFNPKERSMSEKLYGNGDFFLMLDSSKGPLCAPYLEDEDDSNNIYASPLLEKNLSNIPETLFISAECDPLLDQALFYAAALKDAGVNVTFKLYDGMLHGFLNKPYQKTFEAFNEVIKFVNEKRA